MSDDAAPAMRTFRGHGLYRAFETVERMTLALNDNFNTFVVVVSANFA